MLSHPTAILRSVRGLVDREVVGLNSASRTQTRLPRLKHGLKTLLHYSFVT